MRVCIALAVIVVGWAAAVQADIIYLKDGTSVEGKIHMTNDGWSVTKADGTVVNIDGDNVESIEASRGDANQSVAEDRLQSLRAATSHMSDLNDIIDHYQKFIKMTGDPTTLADATKDLQMWQSRLDQGMVKLGDQWISADERNQLRARVDDLEHRVAVLQQPGQGLRVFARGVPGVRPLVRAARRLRGG